MSAVDDLIHRLDASQPGVRRLAILDLVRLHPADPRGAEALLELLAADLDSKSSLAIIRHFAAIGYHPARPALWRLYQNRATPVAIAHAAIVAHDQLVGLAVAGGNDPLESVRGDRDHEESPPA